MYSNGKAKGRREKKRRKHFSYFALFFLFSEFSASKADFLRENGHVVCDAENVISSASKEVERLG